MRRIRRRARASTTAIDEILCEAYEQGIGVGLHLVEGELAEVVSAREEATAYRVEPGSEHALPAALVG